MLVLFSALFVAAWRSDHARKAQVEVVQARRNTIHRGESILTTSAASIGDVLPTCAAGKLAPADQTLGLTLHTAQGIKAALAAALRNVSRDALGPAGLDLAGATLGDQFIAGVSRNSRQEADFVGEGALLSGSWHASARWNGPATTISSPPDAAEFSTADEADADGLEATARLLR